MDDKLDMDDSTNKILLAIRHIASFEFEQKFAEILKLNMVNTTHVNHVWLLRTYMEGKELIKRSSTRNEQVYSITHIGIDIVDKEGGWLKHLENITMADKQKAKQETPKIEVSVPGTGNNVAFSFGDGKIKQKSDNNETENKPETNQSRDESSFTKNAPHPNPIPHPIIIKPITWTVSNILFVISTAVLAGLIVVYHKELWTWLTQISK